MLVTINNTRDAVLMMLIAAGVGGVAGLGAFALQGKLDDGTSLSWEASALVGALASLGILYFVSPVTTTSITVPGGSIDTASQYDLLKLVSLSAIIGSGGRVFLTALQARAGALLNQQTVDNVTATTPKALNKANANIEADIASTKATIAPLADQLRDLAKAPDATAPVKEAATKLESAQEEISKLAEQAQTHLQQAESQIDAAAGQGTPPAGGGAG